jgi:hypothetical protein
VSRCPSCSRSLLIATSRAKARCTSSTTASIQRRARSACVFRNADRSLTPGLFVRLRLPGGASHRGLLIQDRAIGTDLDKRFVFVVNKDHVVEYREVTVGPLIDGLRLVREGLGPDDLVIVNGLQRVRPGARVDAETIAMDAPLTTADASPTQAKAPQSDK